VGHAQLERGGEQQLDNPCCSAAEGYINGCEERHQVAGVEDDIHLERIELHVAWIDLHSAGIKSLAKIPSSPRRL
jgi:hypothetical protein